jgi:hypothetical protein
VTNSLQSAHTARLAVRAAGPEIELQPRWHHQHRSPGSPGAPDRPEPNEPRGSPRSSEVKPGFHLVQRRAALRDQAAKSRLPPARCYG